VGTISYVGMTSFAPGKWIGVTLDEPGGKNDGTVQGKRYFECAPNYGVFLRQTQLAEYTGGSAPKQEEAPSGLPKPSGGLPKPTGGLRRPGFTAPKTAEVKTEEPKSGLPAPSPRQPPNDPAPKIASPTPTKGKIAAPTSGLRRPGSSTGLKQPSKISPPSSKSTSPPSGIGRPSSAAEPPKVPSTPTDTPVQRAGASSVPPPVASIPTPASIDTPVTSTPLKETRSASIETNAAEVASPASGLEGSGLTGPGLPKFTQQTSLSDQAKLSRLPSLSGSVGVSPATSEPSVEPPPPVHRSIAAPEELAELQRKIIEKDKSITDLEEKLAVLKQKRQSDFAKVKEGEKLRMQNEQLIEYKAKWQESQRELQNQLRQLQKEAQEVADRNDNRDDDVQELQEAVEMATLDKEMAEEKYESLSTEHDQLKEQLEEVTLELEILKNEISEGGIENVAATAEQKQIEQQNLRLKEAIVKMKEMAQQDKGLIADLQKQTKEQDNQLSSIQNERDKLREQLTTAETQLDDLKEQVDVALGAEEMVEKLTDKNLELEDKIEQLEETVTDLEALRELNEELEENHVQTEHDLREELDITCNRVRELERQLTAQIEQANDYQETIHKFRDLVMNLQNKIKELQENVNQDEVAPVETEILDRSLEIDFKTKFEEVKQYGRIIELELNKYSVQEANKRVDMVNTFLPDHFTKRGADYDGICMLLLLERLVYKCNMLSSQLHEKYDIADIVEKGQPIYGVSGDQASYAALLSYNLSHLQRIVSQYSRAANTCDVNSYQRVASQYPELAVHEKVVDNFIELLSKDLLDDTISLEVLEKTIGIVQNFYRLHLSNAPYDCKDFLADALVMFSNGAECLSVDVQRMKGMSEVCDEESAFKNLISFLELKNMEVKQFCRKIKRRMIQDSNLTLAYPDSVTHDLLEQLQEQSLLVRYAQDLASVLSLKASSLAEDEKMLSGDLGESATDCITLIYEKEGDPVAVLSESFKKVLLCLSGIALKLPEGDYDTEPEEKVQPPYLGRAAQFKEELSSTTKLEEKIDQKEQEVLTCKKAIKVKADELSQANTRIRLLEKRADNAAKEADVKVEQFSKKHETLQTEFAEKTKQYEKTMDVLQSDIDALEKEKSEMKKRLDAYSKKSLLTDLARHAQSPAAAIAGLVSPGKPGSAMSALAKAGVAGATPPVQVVLNDSPVFLAQLESQKKALQYLKKENSRLMCSKLKAELDALPKPYMPKMQWRDGKFVQTQPDKSTGKEESPTIKSQDVSKECKTLHQNLLDLAVFPKIVDITKTKKDDKYIPTPMEQLAAHNNVLNKLEKQKDELTKKVQTVVSQELPGASVSSSLRTFLSPEYARIQQEKAAPIHIATLKFPIFDKKVKPCRHRVTVTPEEFNQIHMLMTKC